MLIISEDVTQIKFLKTAFEALIAAVFKDLGFDYANEFVTRLINELNFNDLMLESNFKDVLLNIPKKRFPNLYFLDIPKKSVFRANCNLKVSY